LNSDKYRVKIKDLAKKCNPDIFKFATTAEVKPLKGIIGQDRAVRALAFGLDMNNDGYNIYLSGFFGTGKTTLAREMLDKKARSREVPDDWCYVNNFKSIESPKALRLPAGVGKVFKQDIAENMDKVLKQIVKALESEDFRYKKNAI
jgi:Cdc6-like AAA superfamily ATPase